MRDGRTTDRSEESLSERTVARAAAGSTHAVRALSRGAMVMRASGRAVHRATADVPASGNPGSEAGRAGQRQQRDQDPDPAAVLRWPAGWQRGTACR